MLGQSGGTADREDSVHALQDFGRPTCSRARQPGECQNRAPAAPLPARAPHVAVTSVPRAEQKRRRDERGSSRRNEAATSTAAHRTDLQRPGSTHRPSAQRCRIPRGNEDPGSMLLILRTLVCAACLLAVGVDAARRRQQDGSLAWFGMDRERVTGCDVDGRRSRPGGATNGGHGRARAICADSLPEGRYRFTAAFSGFEPWTTEVEVGWGDV